MSEKTITKEQLDAIQKDLEAKHAEQLQKAREEATKEAESKIKTELEAKAKEEEVKTKEKALADQLAELKESQSKIQKDLEAKLAAEKAEYEKKLAEISGSSNRVVDSSNPFDEKPSGSNPKVEDLDLKEVEKLSGAELAKHWGVPPDHPLFRGSSK